MTSVWCVNDPDTHTLGRDGWMSRALWVNQCGQETPWWVRIKSSLTRHTHKRTHTCMNAYTHAHTYTQTLHHHHRHHRNYYHHHNNIFLILPYDPPTSQEAAMARSTYAEELFGTINSTDFSLNLSKPCLEDTALKNMVPLWHLETQMYLRALHFLLVLNFLLPH